MDWKWMSKIRCTEQVNSLLRRSETEADPHRLASGYRCESSILVNHPDNRHMMRKPPRIDRIATGGPTPPARRSQTMLAQRVSQVVTIDSWYPGLEAERLLR